ncbi:probable WRKY transcription factor 70 isoform X2 [Magnolia sinica]|uniref:probable WRKY transcription factor 70 isoform X2 n=1 Tax=Magnolia sinica TaxID=86752 RepID=UPI002658E5FB|nr:probable WRKY transcription factor 70 isoform X2 [Magnolia sinica]
MGSPSSETSIPSHLQMVIQELIHGCDLATELQILLREPVGDHRLNSGEILVEKIMQSFVDALSILNSGGTDEGHQNPAATHLCSLRSNDSIIKDSGKSVKFLAAKVGRVGRGGYKRRSSETIRRFLATQMDEDGHVWRKYGQKDIMGAKFPRSYFRCTHRYDQGCRATKQVQRSEDDSSLFVITYVGHHTCKDVLMSSQFILDYSPREPHMLNFESTIISNEDTPNDLDQSNFLLTYSIPSDLVMLEANGHMTEFSMTPLEPSNSCTGSHTLDMDAMVNSVEFSDVLQ